MPCSQGVAAASVDAGAGSCAGAAATAVASIVASAAASGDAAASAACSAAIVAAGVEAGVAAGVPPGVSPGVPPGVAAGAPCAALLLLPQERLGQALALVGARGALLPFSLGRPCGGRADLALLPDAIGNDGDDVIVDAEAFNARLQVEVSAAALTGAGLGELLVVIENHGESGSAPGPSMDVSLRVSAASNRAVSFWYLRADAWLRRGAAALRPSATGIAASAVSAVQDAAAAAAGSARKLLGLRPAAEASPAAKAWQWLLSLGGSSDSCYAASRSPLARELARGCQSLRASVGARDSLSRQFCESLRNGNVVVPALLVANAAVFLSGGRLNGELVLGHPTARTLLSYPFEHADIYHIIGNMGTLIVVGDEVFSALGCSGPVFIAFYLICGIGAGLFASLTAPRGTRLVGASGAITGVMMALAVLAPSAAVSILPGVDVGSPLAWAVGSALRDMAQNAAYGRNVSWQAHLGGFLAGFVLSNAWLLATAD